MSFSLILFAHLFNQTVQASLESILTLDSVCSGVFLVFDPETLPRVDDDPQEKLHKCEQRLSRLSDLFARTPELNFAPSILRDRLSDAQQIMQALTPLRGDRPLSREAEKYELRSAEDVAIFSVVGVHVIWSPLPIKQRFFVDFLAAPNERSRLELIGKLLVLKKLPMRKIGAFCAKFVHEEDATARWSDICRGNQLHTVDGNIKVYESLTLIEIILILKGSERYWYPDHPGEGATDLRTLTRRPDFVISDLPDGVVLASRPASVATIPLEFDPLGKLFCLKLGWGCVRLVEEFERAVEALGSIPEIRIQALREQYPLILDRVPRNPPRPIDHDWIPALIFESDGVGSLQDLGEVVAQAQVISVFLKSSSMHTYRWPLLERVLLHEGDVEALRAEIELVSGALLRDAIEIVQRTCRSDVENACPGLDGNFLRAPLRVFSPESIPASFSNPGSRFYTWPLERLVATALINGVDDLAALETSAAVLLLPFAPSPPAALGALAAALAAGHLGIGIRQNQPVIDLERVTIQQFEEDEDFVCAICLEMFKQSHRRPCAVCTKPDQAVSHLFCEICTEALVFNSLRGVPLRCPSCRNDLDVRNFLAIP